MGDAQCMLDEYKVVEEQTEERIQFDHRLDSLILLVYVILLVLSVITIWTFKHRRFRYFHESGLSVIYGLIVGIALRYGMKPPHLYVEYHDLSRDSTDNSSCFSQLAPQKLIARLPVRTQSDTTKHIEFQYSFERLADKVGSSDFKATFDPEIFFNVLLPPIIFFAGYSMERRHFFQNIGAILVYAFIGTFVSAIVVGITCFVFTRPIPSLSAELNFPDCLLFGSIISATDPVTVLAIFNDLGVDVDLYALVFGESVLNDALAIALSQSVEQYGARSTSNFDASAFLSSVGHFVGMFGGSFSIGVVVGILTALLTKFTHVRDHPLLETTLFVLMSYSTFLLAETVGFTGIVAVLFCGIIQAHYTYNNLSDESKLWTKQFFELLNFLSENFVFAYIGVSTFTFQQHVWNVWFVLIALLACLLARAVNIYPLSALINLCRGHRPSCVCKSSTPTASADGNVAPDGGNGETGNTLQTSRTRSSKIPLNVQHMLFFSGLRGAMAFSLAIRNTSSNTRQMFFSTTIVVVMITVLLCGGLLMTMLNWLKIRTSISGQDHFQDSTLIDGTRPDRKSRSRFNRYWSYLDHFYFTPLLTNRGPPLTESVPWCCFRLAKVLTTEEQRTLTNLEGHNSRANLCENTDDIAVETHQELSTHKSPTVLFVSDKNTLNRVNASLQMNESGPVEPAPSQLPRQEVIDTSIGSENRRNSGYTKPSSFKFERLV